MDSFKRRPKGCLSARQRPARADSSPTEGRHRTRQGKPAGSRKPSVALAPQNKPLSVETVPDISSGSADQSPPPRPHRKALPLQALPLRVRASVAPQAPDSGNSCEDPPMWVTSLLECGCDGSKRYRSDLGRCGAPPPCSG